MLRKQNDHTSALRAYARLEQLGPVPVEDQPATLIARQARCRMYQHSGDRSRLEEEAAALAKALYSGGARIDRATFALYQEMLRNWGQPPPPPESVARTEAAIALWRSWRAGDLPPRGRKVVRAGDLPVLAVWTAGPERPTAWLAAPQEIENLFGPLWKNQRLLATLYDPEGQRLLGPEQPDALALTPGETRLPFVLRFAFEPGRQQTAAGRARNLLLLGLLFTFALMLAAAYGLYRATTREMAVTRQQSEFISTVSHEFRTPLTSMRHLTELLATGNIPGEERKAQYYDLLARETERLHRMVVSLLSFGRMQARAMPVLAPSCSAIEPAPASPLPAFFYAGRRTPPWLRAWCQAIGWKQA